MPNLVKLNTQEKVTCKKCPLCMHSESFIDEVKALINASRTEIRFSKGETILKQGAYISQAVFIKLGLVKLVREDNKQKITIIKILAAGDSIALPTLAANTFYTYSAICLTDVIICQVPNSSFLQLSKQNELKNRFLATFSDDFNYLYERIDILSTRNNHGKLAWTLVYLNAIRHNNSSALDHITRKELSQFAGISHESVNKILQQLKNDRIIEFDNRQLKILDLTLIETLSTVG